MWTSGDMDLLACDFLYKVVSPRSLAESVCATHENGNFVNKEIRPILVYLAKNGHNYIGQMGCERWTLGDEHDNEGVNKPNWPVPFIG